MFKTALGVMACALLPAAASAMDCQKEFRIRLDRMSKAPAMTSADMIETTRWILQGYDACMKGDMKTAREYFDRTARSKG